MTLKKIIEKKIKDLYKEYDKLIVSVDQLEKTKNDFEIASMVSNALEKDETLILQYNTEDISRIVSKTNFEVINEQLTAIKQVFAAKKEGKNINLTDDQRDCLRLFKRDLFLRVQELPNLIRELEKRPINSAADRLDNDISSLEELFGRLNNPHDKNLLTKDDYKLIHRIFIEDDKIKPTSKNNVLKEYIKYNNSLRTNKEKTQEIVDLEAVKEVLNKYGVHQNTISKLDSFKEEITSNADISKIKEILDYLTSVDELSKKKNIVNSFGESVLISILLYGDVDNIKRVYDYQIKKYGQILGIYLDNSAFWVSNISSVKRRKKSIPSGERGEKLPLLYSYAHETSIEDMELNEQFLQSKGFNISITQCNNIKTIKSRHSLIRDNYQIYQSYGLINENDVTYFPLSSLTFSNVLEHLDNLVEIGLLDDYLVTERTENVYTIMYPTIIQRMKQEEAMFLYHLKNSTTLNDYFDTIFSKKNNGMLANSDIASLMKNNGLNKRTVDEFKAKHFVDLSIEVPNYNRYLDCIYRVNLIIHDEEILNDPLIIELENSFKVTKYSYQFGNQTISRLKVLRYFTALRRFGYINEEALLFCITFGSYIDEETFGIIKESITRGGQR